MSVLSHGRGRLANAAVTALNVISNAIEEPGADSLIQVFQSNGHLQTMLGIEDGTTTLDVSGERYGTQKLDTGCAKLLATEFSAGRRTRAITKVVLHDNRDRTLKVFSIPGAPPADPRRQVRVTEP